MTGQTVFKEEWIMPVGPLTLFWVKLFGKKTTYTDSNCRVDAIRYNGKIYITKVLQGEVR